jgi:hypothetical protein
LINTGKNIKMIQSGATYFLVIFIMKMNITKICITFVTMPSRQCIAN